MSNQITVGISDLKIAKDPDILVTFALGSCVGICLYDAMTKVAGLSHIMLPKQSNFTAEAGSNIMKFADTGIIELISQMVKKGAMRSRITAKIAGGAQMFAVSENSSFGNIGKRNVEAVKEVLKTQNIHLLAEDTGLNYGRTLYFNAADGSMRVKSLVAGEKTL